MVARAVRSVAFDAAIEGMAGRPGGAAAAGRPARRRAAGAGRQGRPTPAGRGRDPPAGELLIASAADPRSALFPHRDPDAAARRRAARSASSSTGRSRRNRSPACSPPPRTRSRGANAATTATVEGTIRVFAGGPVQPQFGFVVHTPDYRRDDDAGGRPVVAMTADDRGAARHRPPPGPGEVASSRSAMPAGGRAARSRDRAPRLVHRPRPMTTLIFDDDRGELWEHALARRTREL